MSAQAALELGDKLIDELRESNLPEKSSAPTMGRLKKVSYTHESMIDLIITDPWIEQNTIAAHFGYTPGWVSNVLASDAFQAAFAKRKDEVVNPELKATIEEHFKALVLQSIMRLKGMLAEPSCPPQVALRAAELGAKALGIGGHAAPASVPPPNRLEVLAERLISLKRSTDERTVNGQVLSTEISKG